MPARKTSKTTASKSASRKSTTVASAKTSPTPSFDFRKLIVPAVIIAIALLLLGLRREMIVASVNGHTITRFDVVKQLEKKDGKAVLDSLVTEQLIFQEAQKRKITVSDSDINKEIATIEKSISGQGQNLDLVLAQQGMTRDDLRDQVKIQLMLKKMVGPAAVSDSEVQSYMEQNKDSLPAGSDSATVTAQVKSQLEQQKIGGKVQTLVASLQKSAKIEYTHSY